MTEELNKFVTEKLYENRNEKNEVETNWRSWKTMVELALDEKNLWGFVDGSSQRPASGDEVQAAWDRDKKKVTRVLMGWLNKDVMERVMNLRDPIQIWNTLTAHFERQSLGNRMLIEEQYRDLKLNSGGALDCHLKELRSYVQKLAAIGRVITEEEQIMVLFRSLPEEYKHAVTSLTMLQGNMGVDGQGNLINLSLEKVESSLQREELAMKTEKVKQSETDFAGQTRGRGRGFNYLRGRCWSCEQLGHRKENCPNRKEDDNGGSNGSSRGYQQHRGRGGRGRHGYNRGSGGRGQLGRGRGSYGRQSSNMAVFDEEMYDEDDWCDDQGEYQKVARAQVQSSQTERIRRRRGAYFYTYRAKTESAIPALEKHLRIIDSGATCHMENSLKNMIDVENLENPVNVTLGDGSQVKADRIGKVPLRHVLKNGKEVNIMMEDVLYVPDLSLNLFSVPAAMKKGCKVTFEGGGFRIFDKSGDLTMEGKVVEDQCIMDCELIAHEFQECENGYPCTSQNAQDPATATDEKEPSALLSTIKDQKNVNVLHWRFGHIGEEKLNKLVNNGVVKGLTVKKKENMDFCGDCKVGKILRQPYHSRGGIASERPFQLLHADLIGPFPVESLGGNKYALVMVDDYSRMVFVMPIRNKSQTSRMVKKLILEIRNNEGWNLGTFRSDQGTEFVNDELKEFFEENGIRIHKSAAYEHEQNGVVERTNRTLQEMMRSIMVHAKTSPAYWAEAILTAQHLHNRTPRSAIGDVTPFELWFGEKPFVGYIRVFGCVAYERIPPEKRGKLDHRARKLRFVGYDNEIKGYRLVDPKTKKLRIARNVAFEEMNFDFTEESENLVKEEELNKALTFEMNIDPGETGGDQHGDRDLPVVQPEVPVEPAQPPSIRRNPVRARNQPSWMRSGDYALLAGREIEEPQTVEEALNGPDKEMWKWAMDAEMKSLKENGTWTLVDLPSNANLVDCKWVFKLKRNGDGSIERPKARLVARGFNQVHGVDYEEIFAPVVKYGSLRCVIALAVKRNMVLHQMDVETAFLNGELEEEIYMTQPEGMVKKGEEGKVCKLIKSLYGLKQAPRCWNKKFTEEMNRMNFVASRKDPCVFIRSDEDKKLTIVTTYVDDLMIAADTEEDVVRVKEELKRRFKMKDLGQLHYLLGISVERTETGVVLHQRQYIKDILKKFGLNDANPVQVPMDTNTKLVKDDGYSKEVDSSLYKSIVGSLLYISLATRPDIAFAVSQCAKFSQKPTTAHLTAIKKVLRYLKGSMDYGLHYQIYPDQEIHGFSDADFAGDLDDRKSTSGWVFVNSGGAVSWISKKQPVVALSTTEAEYISLTSAAQEAIWMKEFYKDLGEEQKTITIYEDNRSAISLTENPVQHQRTKHIDIKFHYIREAIKNQHVNVQYCHTDQMTADVLTKGLPKGKFEKFRDMLGVKRLMC